MPSGNDLVVRRPSALSALLGLILLSACAHKPLVTENEGRELPYGGPTSGKNRFMPPVKPERFKLSEQMSTAWIAFARTGNPNHPGIPAWPAYDTEQRPTLLFNLTSRVVRSACSGTASSRSRRPEHSERTDE